MEEVIGIGFFVDSPMDFRLIGWRAFDVSGFAFPSMVPPNNPYRPPGSVSEPDLPNETNNPARFLLLVFGGFYCVMSPFAVLSGRAASSVSASVFVLACATIWLATWEYTSLCRLVTILWGLALITFFAIAMVYCWRSSNSGGVLFFTVELLVAAPIPVLAAIHSPRRATREMT